MYETEFNNTFVGYKDRLGRIVQHHSGFFHPSKCSVFCNDETLVVHRIKWKRNVDRNADVNLIHSKLVDCLQYILSILNHNKRPGWYYPFLITLFVQRRMSWKSNCMKGNLCSWAHDKPISPVEEFGVYMLGESANNYL